MDSPRVTLYTTRFCPYCTAAKLLLDKRGISYEEVNLGGDPEGRARIVRETGHRTVPVIFVDGVFVGGYVELRALANRGGLDALATAS